MFLICLLRVWVLFDIYCGVKINAKTYTNTWVIEVQQGKEAAEKLSQELSFQYHSQVGSLTDLHIVQHTDVESGNNDTARFHQNLLSSHHHVSNAVQQHVIVRKKRRVDPFYEKQWYLNNSGQTKDICEERHDINVLPIWSRGITGQGIVVSVLDDGLEDTHPDLNENFHAESSYDYNSMPPRKLPRPRYTYDNLNRHGTRCAGEIAATNGNKYCGKGVAYGSKVSGIRMLDGDVSDGIEAASLSHKNDIIDIYSISWGPDDNGYTLDGPGKYSKRALLKGVQEGRGGLGSIFVWATGNGGGVYDYCSCDGYINSPYTISIGAVDNCGRKPWYSELCPGTLAVTYSSGDSKDLQIVTTDLRHRCTINHTGTSAAAPIAAGIFALVLQANPRLTWRDLQHSITRSSKKINPNDPQWQKNGAGYLVNIKFGFGALDVERLVNDANRTDWKTADVRKELTTYKETVNLKKLKNNRKTVTSTILLKRKQTFCLNKLEHVHAIITLRLSYSFSKFEGRRGHHTIKLISPAGTISELLRQRPRDIHHKDGFHDWEFLSVFYWGEYPYGKWLLEVTDHSNGPWKEKRELSWKLRLSGTCGI